MTNLKIRGLVLALLFLMSVSLALATPDLQHQKREHKLPEVPAPQELINSQKMETSSKGTQRMLYKETVTASGERLITELLYQNWENNAWVNALRHTYAYHGSGQYTLYTNEMWNGTSWDVFRRYSYSYNASGKVTMVTTEESYTGKLEFVGRQLYNYDGNGMQNESVYQNWLNGTWENESRYLTYYDNQMRVSESVYQYDENGVWVNSYRDLNTYYDQTRLATYETEFWLEGAWSDYLLITYTWTAAGLNDEIISQYAGEQGYENSSLTSFVYDNQDRKTEQISSSWTGAEWEPGYRNVYVYESIILPGEWTQYITQYWTGQEWDNESREVVEYHSAGEDGRNHNLSYMASEYWSGSDWVVTNSTTTSYDAQDRPLEVIEQVQDYDLGEAVNYSRETYEYPDDDGSYTYIFQMWTESGWLNDYRDLTTINMTNKEATQLNGYWTGEEWYDYERILSYIDEYDFVTESIYQERVNDDFVNYGRYLLTYGTISSIPDGPVARPRNFVVMQNYPNPFNPSTEIRFSLHTKGLVRVDVFDITGRHIKTLMDKEAEAGWHTLQWDSRDDLGNVVASGTYIYRVKHTDFTIAKRMTLIK